MNKKVKLEKKKKTIGYLPPLIMTIIFSFVDNETLWLSIPLTCTYFKSIIDEDAHLINRDCDIYMWRIL
jgi:hypothetical protein